MRPLLASDYLELTVDGAQVLFPVDVNQEVNTSPLEPFSASVVAGDSTLVSDDRIAAQYWSDMRAGIGLQRYKEAESLSGCQDSDLDTRFEGYVMLPPRKVVLAGTVPSGWLPNDHTVHLDDFGGVMVLWWFGSNGIYTSSDSGATWVLRMSGTFFYTIVAWRGMLVAGTVAGIYTSTDGVTYTARWAAGQVACLGTHDNKLYAVVSSGLDWQLYWGVDATLATAWPGKSGDLLYLEGNEAPRKLLEWRNRANVKQVLVLTNRRLIFYDDDDFFAEYARLRPNCTYPDAIVRVADDNLYVSMHPNDFVMRYNNDTYDNISPNKPGGIPMIERFTIGHFVDSLNWLYGFAMPRVGKTYPGRTLAMSLTDNWHTLNRGKRVAGVVTKQVSGGGYRNDNLYTVFSDGTVERQRVMDNNDLPFQVDDQEYEAGPLYLTSAETEAGLGDIDKLTKWWRLDVVDQNNVPGLPSGAAVTMDQSINGGAFSSLGALGTVFPAVFPQPSVADQSGTRWNRLQWRVGLSRGATVTTTPVIRVISNHYRRLSRVYDGFQVTVDLSTGIFEGYPDQKFNGRTREELWSILDTLKKGEKDYKLTYARKGRTLVYPAVDLRISTRQDIATGFGNAIFTLRDTTAPDN